MIRCTTGYVDGPKCHDAWLSNYWILFNGCCAMNIHTLMFVHPLTIYWELVLACLFIQVTATYVLHEGFSERHVSNLTLWVYNIFIGINECAQCCSERINPLRPNAAYTSQSNKPSLAQIMDVTLSATAIVKLPSKNGEIIFAVYTVNTILSLMSSHRHSFELGPRRKFTRTRS